MIKTVIIVFYLMMVYILSFAAIIDKSIITIL